MQLHSRVISGNCRRNHRDRRRANLRSMLYAIFMSRRKAQRRANDTVISYTDHYDSFTFAAALLLMLLCTLDAYFTLLLIQHGSVELNPFLAWALNRHVMFFFLSKYAVTGLFVVVAVMHKNFRMFGVRGIHFLLAWVMAYTVLINYQLSMLLPFWFN